MKLFEDRRVSCYFQSGQLKKDKKTGRRFWLMKLAITMSAADAQSCSDVILSNFQQIEARQNAVDQISIGSTDAVTLKFFEDKRTETTELVLNECLLDGFYMTHDEGLTELWVTVDHENTDALHEFVRDYAFTRFCLEFLPMQRKLGEASDAVMAGVMKTAAEPDGPLQKAANHDGTTLTISSGGTSVTIKPQRGKRETT